MIYDPNQNPQPNWLDFSQDPNLNGSLPQSPPPDRNFIPNDLPANMQPAWMGPSGQRNMAAQNSGPPSFTGLPSNPGSLAPGNSAFGGPGRLGAGQLNRPDTFNPNLAGPYDNQHPQPSVARPGQDNVDSMGTGYQPVPGNGLQRTEGVGYAPAPSGPQPMPQAPNAQSIQYSNGPDQQGMRKYLQPDAPIGAPQQMPRLQQPLGMPPQGQGGMTPEQHAQALRTIEAALAQRAGQGQGMNPNQGTDMGAGGGMPTRNMVDPTQAEAERQRLIAQMRQNEGRPQPVFTPYSNQRAFAPYGDNQR